MRESDINRQLFHAGHYEILAKQFRENFEHWSNSDAPESLEAWSALTNLALSMALRFQADNERFDPVRFLTRCSPNAELYPFGDLWANVVEQAVSHNGSA